MNRNLLSAPIVAVLTFSLAILLQSAKAQQAVVATADDGTLKALTAIAGTGQMQPRAFEFLTELSDDIGARVTGSPSAAQAVDWGVAKMKEIGLENVHTEGWKISHGWTRGSAEAELISPIRRRLMVDALGWVGSTAPGGVEADVVAVNAYQLSDELQNNSASWRGKILLVIQKGEAPKDRMAAFAKFGDFLKAAHAAGAVAVIGGQGGRKATGMHLTHTGALGFDTYYDIPVVSMAAEDQEQYKTIPQIEKAISKIKKEMEKAARDLDFMEAARLRDEMFRLQKELESMK